MGGGGGGWASRMQALPAIGQQTVALCPQHMTGMYTNHRIDWDGRWQQFSTQATLFTAPQWSHRPCNAPTRLYRVGKKPSVKADLAIYSQIADASGQCMSVSLILGFKLDFSSCDNLVSFCKSSHICTYLCVCRYMYVCMYVSMCLCVSYVCACFCVVCAYVYVCICMYVYISIVPYLHRYKLPASIVKLFALWKSTWCMLCTKKKLLNALLEKWRRFETLRTSLLTFLSEAIGYCNPPFEQLGMMTSLMDIDYEMKNFKVSSTVQPEMLVGN